MIDSNGTSASTGDPTPVDDGTPAGHPTPAGEPSQSEQPDLFPGARICAPITDANPAILEAIGHLVLAWGQIEQTTAEKVSVMRQAFGDVRAVGARARPTMQKMLAELRALVAMRDRHDKQALAVIAEIDGALQRTVQFRQLILEGAHDIMGDILCCRDVRNSPIEINLSEIRRAASQIERLRHQIVAL